MQPSVSKETDWPKDDVGMDVPLDLAVFLRSRASYQLVNVDLLILYQPSMMYLHHQPHWYGIQSIQ